MDIEGTTSSIRFVADEMFPFARRNLAAFLEQNESNTTIMETTHEICREATSLGWSDTWPGNSVVSAVNFLMDRDAKTTGLKQLQGMIWESGFHSGELIAHVYDEVPGCLRKWRAQGLDLRIYSSGSVTAQKLFFGHTSAGNLLDLFTAHYDTNIGAKRETQSYAYITKDFGLPPQEIVFISDIVEELEAAAEVGLQCILSIRSENASISNVHPFRSIRSFDEVFFA